MFWSFDDAKSVALKSHYVDAYGLGGIMCWEISGDDSIGTLVNAMATGNTPGVEVAHEQSGKSQPSVEIMKPENIGNLVEGSNVIINPKNALGKDCTLMTQI